MYDRTIEFCNFLRFFYWILETFGQCDIFLFVFQFINKVENDGGGIVTNQKGSLIDIKRILQ